MAIEVRGRVMEKPSGPRSGRRFGLQWGADCADGRGGPRTRLRWNRRRTGSYL